jgi:tRNA modification GTPase
MIDPRRSRDTIAAIATPPGDGGVGIIRISGDRSRAISARIFRPARASFTDFIPYTLHYGSIVDDRGAVLDDALVVCMPGPGSYTGEDVVEINCHGGRAVLAAVLEEVLRCGARLAERGEFTYRAFIHGRLDLTQAEAVAEMIHAPTRSAAHLAQAKFSGLLGQRIAALRARLETLRAQLAVAVDFPDDEVECLPPDTLAEGVAGVRADIADLLRAVDRTRTWREGALVVLAGRVNAGKSSLMNALLGRTRAIVTDQPGTTRDYLEETVILDGLSVRLVDTAGMRPDLPAHAADIPIDAVEAAGMAMGRELMDRADLVLLLADGTAPLDSGTLALASEIPPERSLAVLTRRDLPGFDLANGVPLAALGFEIVDISSVTGHGLDALCARIRERVLAGAGQPDPDELAPNARQAATLAEAAEELRQLEADALAAIPYDLLGVRLESACAILSSITGEITSQEVLASIFDTFCIGK